VLSSQNSREAFLSENSTGRKELEEFIPTNIKTCLLLRIQENLFCQRIQLAEKKRDCIMGASTWPILEMYDLKLIQLIPISKDIIDIGDENAASQYFVRTTPRPFSISFKAVPINFLAFFTHHIAFLDL